jgi:hypothetical protein
VHFAAVPSYLLRSDNLTYLSNVMSTYNVLEATMKLCVREVIDARDLGEIVHLCGEGWLGPSGV